VYSHSHNKYCSKLVTWVKCKGKVKVKAKVKYLCLIRHYATKEYEDRRYRSISS